MIRKGIALGLGILLVLGILVFSVAKGTAQTYAANTTSFTVITSDGYYNSHGDIALLTNGNLLVVYRKGTTHASDQANIVGKISTDLGATWGAEFLVFDPRTHPNLNYDAQMPSITVLKTGRIIVTFQLNSVGGFLVIDGIGYILSDDLGATWVGFAYLDSKFTNYAQGPGRVAELPDGTLLLPLYGQNLGDTYTSTSYFKSTTGDNWYGDSWLNAETICANGEVDHVSYDEPYLVSLGGSNVLLLMRTLPDRYFYSSHSSDNGATWSKPVRRFEAMGRPSVTRLSNGRLLMVTRSYAPPQASVYRTSDDGGYFWSLERTLDTDWYPNEYGGSIEADGKAYIVYFVEKSSGVADARLTMYQYQNQ